MTTSESHLQLAADRDRLRIINADLLAELGEVARDMKILIANIKQGGSALRSARHIAEVCEEKARAAIARAERAQP